MESLFFSLIDISDREVEIANSFSLFRSAEPADSISMTSAELQAQPENILLKIVVSASNLALNSVPFSKKRLKTPGKQIDAAPPMKKSISRKLLLLASSLVSIVSFQTRIVLNGIFNVVKEKRRDSWDYQTQFTFHWLQQSLTYKKFHMDMIREGEELISHFNNLNVDPHFLYIPIEYTVDYRKLIWFEKAGLGYQKQKGNRYPIPAEYPLPSSSYKLEAEWILPREAEYQFSKPDRKVILYIHGGAFIIANPTICRYMSNILSSSTNFDILAVNYRKAPENPFPAGLHDAFSAYLWLIDPHNEMFGGATPTHEPYLASNVIFAGDSAGGNLCLALLNYLNMYLRNKAGKLLVELPKGAILISPWCDLTCSSKSWHENAVFDILPAHASNIHEPIFPDCQHPVYSYCFGESSRKQAQNLDIMSPQTASFEKVHSLENLPKYEIASPVLEIVSDNHFGEQEKDGLERFIRHPLVSPIYGSLKGLCPILIQAGECELLRDETLALAYRYDFQNKHTDSWIRHELYDDMVHNFQVGNAWGLPAAVVAAERIKYFCNELFNFKNKPCEIWEGMVIDSHSKV